MGPLKVIVLLAVVVGGGMAATTWVLQRECGDRVRARDGVVAGVIKSADAERGLVRVECGLFNVSFLAIIVEPGGEVVVDDRIGVIADLRPGQRITATYQTRADGLVSRRIAVETPTPNLDALLTVRPAPATETPPAAPLAVPVSTDSDSAVERAPDRAQRPVKEKAAPRPRRQSQPSTATSAALVPAPETPASTAEPRTEPIPTAALPTASIAPTSAAPASQELRAIVAEPAPPPASESVGAPLPRGPSPRDTRPRQEAP